MVFMGTADLIKHGRLNEQELYHVVRELRRYKNKAKPARITGYPKENKETRNATACWAETTIAPYSFNILQSHVIQQYHQYPLDTTEIAEIQYTSYDIDGIFVWHQDNVPNTRQDKRVRGITMSINLSDPSTYTGGELLVKTPDSQEVCISRQMGSYMMFPSFLKHQACRVESGKREALVVWTYLTEDEMLWMKNQCVR